MDLSELKSFAELFVTWSNMAIAPAVDPTLDVVSSMTAFTWVLLLG